MKRYVLKISIEKATGYTHHKRDVVSVLPKEKVIEYFEKQYENHKKTGTVTIKVEMELPCNDIFEVL
jgi:hypothetical protein